MNFYNHYDKLIGAFQEFVNSLYALTGQRLTELVLTPKQLHLISNYYVPYGCDAPVHVQSSPSLYGVPITVKSTEPKKLTLLPELGVIIWHSKEPTCQNQYTRKLRVPCPQKINSLECTGSPPNEPVLYKEYLFEKVFVFGKEVWMTPYIPGDETLLSLI